MALQIKEFDKWFSLWNRLKDSDWKGFTKCYTCPSVEYFKYLQDGHLFSRRNYSVRFDVDDNRPQCIKCNCILGGNLVIYREKLEAEIGKEKVEELERLARIPYKWSQSEMREKIEYYKKEVKRLANEKSIRL